MTRHTIGIADFQNQTLTHEAAASFGQGSAKSLVIVFTIPDGTLAYRVDNNRKPVLATTDLQAAIDAYNALP